MRYKLIAFVAVAASVFALPSVAQAAPVEPNTLSWDNFTYSPTSVNDGFDSVDVEMHTDDAVNSNFDTTGMRFTAVVAAQQANTRVSIERVALSSQSRVLFVWTGKRLGPNGIAKVGPSYPWKPASGCYYRMRINFSVRWSNGQLVSYSWLTGWQRDYWVQGC